MLACAALFAQDAVFRTETSLATVPFHAVQKHQYLVDLTPQDIILLEDGQPREITYFEGGLSR